jgi:hypothetical protein
MLIHVILVSNELKPKFIECNHNPLFGVYNSKLSFPTGKLPAVGMARGSVAYEIYIPIACINCLGKTKRVFIVCEVRIWYFLEVREIPCQIAQILDFDACS